MRLSPARPGFKSRRGNTPFFTQDIIRNNKKSTACGDRTRDQSIKSRTLYLTELRRHSLHKTAKDSCFHVASGQWLQTILLQVYQRDKLNKVDVYMTDREVICARRLSSLHQRVIGLVV